MDRPSTAGSSVHGLRPQSELSADDSHFFFVLEEAPNPRGRLALLYDGKSRNSEGDAYISC